MAYPCRAIGKAQLLKLIAHRSSPLSSTCVQGIGLMELAIWPHPRAYSAACCALSSFSFGQSAWKRGAERSENVVGMMTPSLPR